MNTKPKNQDQEEEVDEINFMVASIGDNPTGLSNPSPKGKNLADFVEALQSVDLNSSDAEANKTSISDNNGGRIDLEEDLNNKDVIKK